MCLCVCPSSPLSGGFPASLKRDVALLVTSNVLSLPYLNILWPASLPARRKRKLVKIETVAWTSMNQPIPFMYYKQPNRFFIQKEPRG